MTEVAEVAREVVDLHGERPCEAAGERLGMEIYDVVWNLCDLAGILGIDLEAAFARKVALNQRRIW